MWIYDTIHFAINEYCSGKTLNQIYIEEFDQIDESLVGKLQKNIDKNIGINYIKILTVRLSKPKIPSSILQQYEKIEINKTSQKSEIARSNVEKQRIEIEIMKEKMLREKDMIIQRLENEKKLEMEKTKLKISEINNEIITKNEKTKTDAEV